MKKIGILGGGQLGKMLIEAKGDLDIDFFILEKDKTSPAGNVAEHFIYGDILDFNDVYNFGKLVDIITIEIEHVNVDALFKLKQEGKKIFPDPEIIKTVQDKGLQKEFYRKNNIPTADFLLIEKKDDIKKHLNFLPVIQKTRKAGYDGKGVYKISSESSINSAFDVPSVLEKLIDIKKEISIIVARNECGEIKPFPAVELIYKEHANLVDYLISPADISADVLSEAEKIAIKIASLLKIVGVVAVEMFLTKDNKILVNEIAPRPHNSGHQTIEGNSSSQYIEHLRAILNLPLGNTNIIKPSVMVNLLGEEGYSGESKILNLEKISTMENIFIHIYGKQFTHPNRKMGHITILDDNINKAIEKAIFIKSQVKVISSEKEK